MNTGPENDLDLRERFAAERSRDLDEVPALGRVLGGTRRSRRRTFLHPAWALGAVAVAAVVITLARRPDVSTTDAPFAVVPGDLRVPTDYFLDLASTMRADEMPAIGAIDWYPLVPGGSGRPNATSRRN